MFKSSIYFFIVLLTYCINGWAWKVKVFNYNCGLSVSPFHSLRFWLLYSEIAYTFLTIMSPQWIEFSIIMYCPLSSAKNLHSEVYFYDVNSASPAFIWFGIWRYKYFHKFNFKLLAIIIFLLLGIIIFKLLAVIINYKLFKVRLFFLPYIM